MQRAEPASYSLGPTASDTDAAGDAQPPAPPRTGQQRPDARPEQLPRLHPPPRPDERRAPEVTVNIGRIEVAPPARPEPPRMAEKRPARTAASGAPKLADYLRDRSRR